MSQSRASQRSARTLYLIAALNLPASAFAADANWLGGNGTWTDPTKWSTNPFFPDNGNGGQTYNAILNAAGSHTITLNTSIAIDSLLLNSASATLLHSTGTLTSLGTFTLQAGTYRINGGTIRGATINRSGGSFIVGSSDGTLSDNARLIGDYTFTEASAALNFRSGADFTGSATLGISSNALSYLYTNTIGSGRTINMDGTSSRLDVSSESGSASSTLTIAAGATVRGRGTLSSDTNGAAAANTIVNNGQITGDITDARLNISPDIFINNGTVTLNGGTLVLDAGSWSSAAGRITVNDGTLVLSSNFATADLNVASFTRNGGTVTILGNVNNNGATLPLSASTGTFRLLGTIDGGTITQAAGAHLVGGSQTGTLSGGAVLVGDLDLDENNGDLVFTGGANFTGNGNLTGSSTQIGYTYDATIGAGRTITFNNTSTRLDISANGTLSSTLTIASGATVRALNRGSISSDTFGVADDNHVINNGLIIADDAAANLAIAPDRFTNNGTVSVAAGSITISAANWSSAAGVLAISDGTLVLSGNVNTAGLHLSAMQRSGGTVTLSATVDNSGSTFALTDATGMFRFTGTINGGTISQTALGRFAYVTQGGTISNSATMIGDLTMDLNNGRVYFGSGADFTGNATLSGSNTVLSYGYNKTIASGRVINLEANGAKLDVSGSSTTDPSTLTIAQGATVRGRGAITADNFVAAVGNRIINRGLIAADINAASISISSDLFTNEGTLSASGGGDLVLDTVLTSGTGTISASGAGSALRILGGIYDVNRTMRTSNGAVINLQGAPTKAADFDIGGIVIFNYAGASPLAQFRDEIISGRANGQWNGPGIFSSAASQGANAGRTGIGFAETTAMTGVFPFTFAGEAGLDDSTIIMRFTYYGDATLDGKVDVGDLGRLATNWQQQSTWSGGDFNYDGMVNVGDLGVLATNWQLGVAAPQPLGPSFAAALSALGLPQVSIPEPATLSLLAFVAALRRKRR